MSDADGMDNLAFTNEEDTKLENGGPQQVTLDQDSKSSGDGAPIENGHQRSFISQHYVEPIKPSSEPCYKTETRIELPADNAEKSVSEPKLNGVHGNGNNNDASFLNNSSTSVQVNGKLSSHISATYVFLFTREKQEARTYFSVVTISRNVVSSQFRMCNRKIKTGCTSRIYLAGVKTVSCFS